MDKVKLNLTDYMLHYIIYFFYIVHTNLSLVEHFKDKRKIF